MVEEQLGLSKVAFNVRNYISLASLLCLVIDYASTCKFEVNHIWRRPKVLVSFLYLFSRYTGLITMIAHFVLVHKLLAHAPVPLKICRNWFLVFLASCAIQVLVLDSILFLRAYALYKKNPKVFLLTIPIILQFVIAAILITLKFSNENVFNHQCDLQTVPFDVVYLAISVILAHGALWLVTFVQRKVAGGEAAVVKLVVHEGAWIFVLLLAIVAGIFPYSYASRVGNPTIIFGLPTTMISIASCRIIMNMRRLKVEPRGSNAVSTSDFRLSTVIQTSHGTQEDLELKLPP